MAINRKGVMRHIENNAKAKRNKQRWRGGAA